MKILNRIDKFILKLYGKVCFIGLLNCLIYSITTEGKNTMTDFEKTIMLLKTVSEYD